ncbi:MAG: hypothetical protein M3680_12355, partial [Myxococcota bacterium]|nr:hypothetical protein [Myxococcota bacterium]
MDRSDDTRVEVLVRRLLLLLTLSLGACGQPAAPAARPAVAATAPVAAPVAAPEPWIPVAGYLNPELATDQTQAIIAALLAAHHVEWAAVGSLGYTVDVTTFNLLR